MTNHANALASALSKAGVSQDEQQDLGMFLSTGVPNVDYALSGKYVGGGLKSSRIFEIAGPESSGKTLIAQHIMREAQRAGGAAAFHDHERTFDPNLAQSFGLDTSDGVFTYKRPRTFEESLDQAIDWMTAIRESGAIPFEAPLAIVFDSLHAMVPAAMTDHDTAKGRNMKDKLSLATATSSELPAFALFCEENNVIAIFLNQLRTKPAVMYGDPRYTPGGSSLDFYASARVFLDRKMMRLDKPPYTTIGQEVTADVIKNKVHKPFEKASWKFKFKDDGTGFIDKVESMVDHLHDRKLLEQSGAYFVWEGKKLYKSQLVKQLSSEPDAMDKLIAIAQAADEEADD